MAETKPVKKGTNPLVFIGIGCLALLVILGIASSIVMHFFAKRIGTGLLQSAIESRTGVKTNLQDLQNGKMTLTDQKTGAKMDIGSGQIPDSFPKDFPIYPGSKVTSSLSGAQQGKSNGFWVTLTTADSFDKVDAYYKNALSSSGWKTSSTFSTSGTTTSGVTKGTMSGSLSITQTSGNKETDIVVVLGTDTTTETPSE